MSSSVWNGGPASSSIPYEGATSTTATASSSAASATGGGGGGGGLLTGPCTNEGLYNCIGGTAFQRCASGQWSAAEPMAPGTRCAPGLSDGPTITGRRARLRRLRGLVMGSGESEEKTGGDD